MVGPPVKDGNSLKQVPDDKVYVIDQKASPPMSSTAARVTVGKQPSGVLSVRGTDVKVIDTIDMGDIVSHVAFTPDGTRVACLPTRRRWRRA